MSKQGATIYPIKTNNGEMPTYANGIKYELLPNYDENNSVILLGDDDSRKVISVLDGRLVIETIPGRSSDSKPAVLKVEDLHLSPRSYNCLTRRGCEDTDDITALHFDQFRGIRNFGYTSQIEVLNRMSEAGFGEWVERMLRQSKATKYKFKFREVRHGF